jgi:hypothetical protein
MGQTATSWVVRVMSAFPPDRAPISTLHAKAHTEHCDCGRRWAFSKSCAACPSPSVNSNLEIFATHPHMQGYAEGPPSIAFLPISFFGFFSLASSRGRAPNPLFHAVGGGDSEISTQPCDRNTQSR